MSSCVKCVIVRRHWLALRVIFASCLVRIMVVRVMGELVLTQELVQISHVPFLLLALHKNEFFLKTTAGCH